MLPQCTSCTAIHRLPVHSPHKGQWRGALMLYLICALTNGWVNNRDAGDLRRHRAHYDATVLTWRLWYTYGRDVVGYWQLRLTSRCRHPDPGQYLIPLQRLHVFAHSRDPHPAIKLWCQVPFTKSKNNFSNWNVLYAVLFEKQIY